MKRFIAVAIVISALTATAALASKIPFRRTGCGPVPSYVEIVKITMVGACTQPLPPCDAEGGYGQEITYVKDGPQTLTITPGPTSVLGSGASSVTLNGANRTASFVCMDFSTPGSWELVAGG